MLTDYFITVIMMIDKFETAKMNQPRVQWGAQPKYIHVCAELWRQTPITCIYHEIKK